MADFTAILGNVLLFALVFGMSATVDVHCMQEQIRNYRAIVTGLGCQFVLLPLLGFCVTKTLFPDNHAIGIMILVVTSSPGGSYSNWWCSLFNADLALSVTMTAISTILSIGVLPLNLLLYTRWSYESDVIRNLDWKALFVALAVVISAICIGLFLSFRKQSFEFNRRANQLGNMAGLTLIIFSAFVANTGDADSKIWSRSWDFYVGVALPCLAGLIIANILASLCHLKHPERITVAIECCYQNVGIATSLALTMFDGDELNDAMGVPFFYGLVEGLFIGVYCIGVWKMGWTKAPRDESFWKVLVTSYEVIAAEKQELNAVEISYSESGELPGDEHSEDGQVLTTYFKYSNAAGIGGKTRDQLVIESRDSTRR